MDIDATSILALTSDSDALHAVATLDFRAFG
jgi:hypothetical protein